MKPYLIFEKWIFYLAGILFLVFALFGCSSIKQSTETKEKIDTNTFEKITTTIEDKEIPVPPYDFEVSTKKDKNIDSSNYSEVYHGTNNNGDSVEVTKDKNGNVKVRGNVKPPAVEDRDTTTNREKFTNRNSEKETLTKQKIEPGFWESAWITIKGIWYLIPAVLISLILLPYIKKLFIKLYKPL